MDGMPRKAYSFGLSDPDGRGGRRKANAAVCEAPAHRPATASIVDAQPVEAEAGPAARLYLLGPIRLIDRHGVDRTPRGAMRAAMLAVLALSPHGTKARARLQDLLWGGRDQEQGGQSLRTAICLLKRDLAALPGQIVEADKQVVRLDVSRLWIDVFEYLKPENHLRLRQEHGLEPPDLLEGLNVRADDDEAFEDWLREERSRWMDTFEEILDQIRDRPLTPPPEAAPPPTLGATLHVGETVSRPNYGVGLLPTLLALNSPHAAFLGDLVVDAIANGLRALALAEIYDYRDGGGSLGEDAGPRLLVQAKVFEDRDRLMLSLTAFQAERHKLLWSWTSGFPCTRELSLDSGAVAAFVGQAVERVCNSLREPGRSVREITPFHALNLMFRLDGGSLEAARTELTRASEDSGDPVHLSLLAYLNSFRVGDHWREYDEAMLQETRYLVEGVMAESPYNSLALALTGHCFGYILHDYATAGELLERATELNPNIATVWDHLALNHFYCGRLGEAEAAVQVAMRIGSASPLRFTFETTQCMIATLRGDYVSAVLHGERALARQPTFGAALRYVAVSLGHLGRIDAAHDMVARIRALDHDFSSDWALGERIAVADDANRRRLLTGLKKAGA